MPFQFYDACTPQCSIFVSNADNVTRAQEGKQPLRRAPGVEQAEQSQLSDSGPSGGRPTQALCCHTLQPSHSVMASPSSSAAPHTHFICVARCAARFVVTLSATT